MNHKTSFSANAPASTTFANSISANPGDSKITADLTAQSSPPIRHARHDPVQKMHRRLVWVLSSSTIALIVNAVIVVILV